MSNPETIIKELKNLVDEMQAVICAEKILAWDLEINMPKTASRERAWQMSILSKIVHEMLISSKMQELLNNLRKKELFELLKTKDKAMVRELGRDFDKAIKIPTDLIRELTETTAQAQVVWAEAKTKNDFKLFAPHLEKIFSLKRQMAEYLGYKDSPYDALLDEYEPGMNTKTLDELFENLKKELIPYIKKIQCSNNMPNNTFLKQSYNKEKQLQLCNLLLETLGFDLKKGILEESIHPFTMGISPNDVRLTTRTDENNLFFAIGSTIHEGGHALYEQGIDSKLFKTNLYSGSSLGIHESQSRLYETIIGQGYPFWKYYFPVLKDTFKKELSDISLEEFYNGLNCVEPSLIRVEADEVTYNLHIVIRYEIEKDLMEKKLMINDIPKAWKEKMHNYLGVTPQTDAEGALQDIHWSFGAIGYFPTYTMGNLCAAQFYNQIRKEIPDIEQKLEKGDFKELREYLKEKIHQYGLLETPEEILQRVTGEPLKTHYFINYIKEKYNKIYSLN
ncbi:MAG: carboxypeptidase M32 [Candidatus Melainabacteria bacterium]|nr:carboxypeptidase M32 [Candidatus Melainabacteria bacterium]